MGAGKMSDDFDEMNNKKVIFGSTRFSGIKIVAFKIVAVNFVAQFRRNNSVAAISSLRSLNGHRLTG